MIKTFGGTYTKKEGLKVEHMTISEDGQPIRIIKKG